MSLSVHKNALDLRLAQILNQRKMSEETKEANFDTEIQKVVSTSYPSLNLHLIHECLEILILSVIQVTTGAMLSDLGSVV